MTDTVRSRVSLSPMVLGAIPGMRPNDSGATLNQRAFFFAVFAVVYRASLRLAHKESTDAAPMRIRGLCQRGHRSFRLSVRRAGLSLRPTHTGKMQNWRFLPCAPNSGARREEKAELCLNFH